MQPAHVSSLFQLEYPKPVVVVNDYETAQKVVDHLSDKEFPVQQLMIVGTDLKRIERITGRLEAAFAAEGVDADVREGAEDLGELVDVDSGASVDVGRVLLGQQVDPHGRLLARACARSVAGGLADRGRGRG